MKIQYWKNPALQEDLVDVHYREENETIAVIRDFFGSFNRITGKNENGVRKLHPDSIYYLEVVDRKLFACLETDVYELAYTLHRFLDLFSANGFVRIGKSAAVNVYKVGSIQADFNMHLRLRLDNDEILILNRSYKKSFLAALQHIREVCHETDS